MHIFVESGEPIAEPYLEDGLWGNPFDAHNEPCIQPGALYRWETLVRAGVSVGQLQCVHVELLVAFVRNERGEFFHPSFLVDINPSFALTDLLFTVWADQLTPDVTRMWKLDASALLDAGLTRRMVKKRWWRYTRWRELFGFDPDTLEALRVSDPAAVFPEFHGDVERYVRTDWSSPHAVIPLSL